MFLRRARSRSICSRVNSPVRTRSPSCSDSSSPRLGGAAPWERGLPFRRVSSSYRSARLFAFFLLGIGMALQVLHSPHREPRSPTAVRGDAGASKTRLFRQESWRGALAFHGLRALVFAEALERRMPEDPVVGPFRERDLGDQLRLDPVHAAFPGASRGIRERWRGTVESTEPLLQLGERPRVESRSDASGEAKLAILVDAHEQRSERRARAAWIRPA